MINNVCRNYMFVSVIATKVISGTDLEEGREDGHRRRIVSIERRKVMESLETSPTETQSVMAALERSGCEDGDWEDGDDDVSELDITAPSRIEMGITLVGDEIEGKDELEILCD